MGGYVGLVHNLLIQFFTLDSLKMEVFETCFSDIMTTQNDHPRYVKHVLSRIYVLLTLFAYQVRGGGGGLLGDWYTTCFAAFHPGHLQNQRFRNLFL